MAHILIKFTQIHVIDLIFYTIHVSMVMYLISKYNLIKQRKDKNFFIGVLCYIYN
jgi:phosphatidylserine synthase